ncbi:MAG: MotA/TolQ/ExbB proton channel family protein, partial [Burkholderiales bacterium]
MFVTNRMSALLAAVTISAAMFAVTAHAVDAPAAGTPATASAPAAPAADSGAAAVAPTTGAVSKEEVANPYGPDALWKNGDFVARSTLIILAIMSMGSWYIIVGKLIDQFRLMGQAGEVKSKFWKANSIAAGSASLKETSPFRFIAESGSKSMQHHDGALLEQIDLNTWVTMAIQRAVEKVQSRLQDGLAFLATVGSTAPFVGLFGTVWGIYNALTQIGVAGQASIDKVAGPVG